MKIELPAEMYVPNAGRERVRSQGVWVLLTVLLVSGWQIFGLPGAPITPVIAPKDMLGFGFGFAGCYVEPDGTWVIHREGYADRRKRYTYTPDGTLQTSRESGVYSGEDVGGAYRGTGVLMSRRSALKVVPGPGFYAWRRSFQIDRTGSKDESRAGTEQSMSIPNSKSGKQATALENAAPKDEVMEGETQPSIVITGASQQDRFPILAGTRYFPIFDSACFIDPDLWITTDKVTRLHHIHASDASGELEVRELSSQDFVMEALPEDDTALVFDPIRSQLALLLPDGRRYWIDPQSLAVLASDKLPGYWKREHASLGNPLGRFGLRSGYGLSEDCYKRVMGLLVIVFLASLLRLAWLWRTPWKYTLAATTEDSSSSGKPGSF